MSSAKVAHSVKACLSSLTGKPLSLRTERIPSTLVTTSEFLFERTSYAILAVRR